MKCVAYSMKACNIPASPTLLASFIIEPVRINIDKYIKDYGANQGINIDEIGKEEFYKPEVKGKKPTASKQGKIPALDKKKGVAEVNKRKSVASPAHKGPYKRKKYVLMFTLSSNGSEDAPSVSEVLSKNSIAMATALYIQLDKGSFTLNSVKDALDHAEANQIWLRLIVFYAISSPHITPPSSAPPPAGDIVTSSSSIEFSHRRRSNSTFPTTVAATTFSINVAATTFPTTVTSSLRQP
ncbi:hypothetical protein LINPERPRIM_LOCUS41135 [Linum perenne]